MDEDNHYWYTYFELPRAMLEFAALLQTLPMLAGAPRGDDHHVLVIPAFGQDDSSTVVLRQFLDSLGYHGRPWELGRNLGLRRLGGYDQLIARVKTLARESGDEVSIIGADVGAIHGRAVATIVPGFVRQVISLGAPIGGPLEETAIWRVYQSVNGKPVEKRFTKKFVDANRQPPPVPCTAIFSRTDGIVPWRMALEQPSPTSENVEVFTSHTGMTAHPAVYYLLAERLAQPDDEWQQFEPTGWQKLVFGPDPLREAPDLTVTELAKHKT